MIYLQLFLTFLKIGAVSFGGGYAMIPMMKQECAEWLTESQLMNFIAVSESTPGPIAVNMATFIGSSQGGILGALCATLGVVLPSFIIILLIAAVIKNLLKFAGVKAALSAVRPAIVALITATAVTMFLSTIFALSKIEDAVKFDWKGMVILAIVVFVAVGWKLWHKKAISPILLILLSGGIGVAMYL